MKMRVVILGGLPPVGAQRRRVARRCGPTQDFTLPSLQQARRAHVRPGECPSWHRWTC